MPQTVLGWERLPTIESVKSRDVVSELAPTFVGVTLMFRLPLFERGDRLAQTLAGLLARLGLEDRPDQGAQQAVLVLAGVAEAVPEEVHLMGTSP